MRLNAPRPIRSTDGLGHPNQKTMQIGKYRLEGGETGRNSMKEKRVQRSQKRRAAKAQPSRASAIGSAYTMRLAALKGNIWDDIEDIDISEHFGLCDAFAAGAAKCLGLTKRTGWPTRIIFVCRPNDRGDPRGTVAHANLKPL